MNREPYTVNRKPRTLNPKLHTPTPKPQTLNPKPKPEILNAAAAGHEGTPGGQDDRFVPKVLVRLATDTPVYCGSA